MQDPKVSVIIPIYNASRFLEQALDSIDNQTYENLEIIALNDGSTDDSLEIIKQHAKNDDRYIVIDKENEGYGATCNRGLDIATGEWISVFEPDDYADVKMFDEMIRFVEKFDEQIDIVKTPWYLVYGWYKEDEEETWFPSPLYRRIPTSEKPITLADCTFFIENHPSIWSAIYRREFLNENNIRFIEYPGAGWADNPFLIDTMVRANAIVYLDKPFYYYRADSPGSTLFHQTEETIARPFDRWIAMMDILEELKIDDIKIIEGHYVRGFNYIAGAIYDDGWDNPIVVNKTREVFARMDKDIVINHPKLHTERKLFYLLETGQEADVGNNKAYRRYLIEEVKRNYKVMGLRDTIYRIREHDPKRKDPIALRNGGYELIYDKDGTLIGKRMNAE